MKTSVIIAAACAAATFTTAFMNPAAAQTAVEIGTLDCAIGPGAGFIVGSSKDLTCTFQDIAKRLPAETYFGHVNKFGLDIGATEQSLMQWLVLAPTRDAYRPGALAGSYVGASAEATVAVGAGANVLVSDSNRTFTLQPVSVQEQTGLNLALGVSSFVLRTVTMR
ncbi:DUF992 domain-containing protein [Pseudaminobacter salicylatoxidans]|uniref:DUF992 domain-containing protein n=1 Tax=Pseudaminobacter salicylatoxidans TaxID=93369 RepID=UPI0002EB0640|nr:DUF992 domain-containing protein [Pseudaminobacter salicylatoxidans]